MREFAETVAEATFTLRATTLAQAFLRLVTLASIGVAAALCAVWFPFEYASVASGGIIAVGLASVVLPDSPAPTIALGGVVVWWAAAGGDAAWWQVLIVGMLLAAFHIGVALSAVAPPWAHAGQRVVRRWFGTAGRYLALTAAGLGITVGVAAIGDVPWGTVWVVLGAGSLTAAALAVLRALHRD